MQDPQGKSNSPDSYSAHTPNTEAELSVGEPDDDYRGLPLERAGDLARERGVVFRVIRENGRPLRVSMGHQPQRLNFALEGGCVVTVTRG